jgi:hypothetical protein
LGRKVPEREWNVWVKVICVEGNIRVKMVKMGMEIIWVQ